jgi:putative transposase
MPEGGQIDQDDGVIVTACPAPVWRLGRAWAAASGPQCPAAWVTHQARNLALGLDARTCPVRFLIRDRDAKFSRSFDEVIRSEGARVIVTPVRAPNANAHAERVVETMRAECLDWTLILGPRHLDWTLRTYVDHYNRGRPHRALGLASPLLAAGQPIPVDPRDVRRRDLLGGLIHEYHGVAA